VVAPPELFGGITGRCAAAKASANVCEPEAPGAPGPAEISAGVAAPLEIDKAIAVTKFALRRMRQAHAK